MSKLPIFILYFLSIFIYSCVNKTSNSSYEDTYIDEYSDVFDSLLCPDENHPHLVDLGLTSGTKWTCCNIGAEVPSSFGNYYSWAELEEKENYSINSYQHVKNPKSHECKYLDYNIANTQYDVARLKLGNDFQMPSRIDFMELIKECKLVWVKCNDLFEGISVTGKNGNKIFLPSAAYKDGKDIQFCAAPNCNYWTADQNFDNECIFNAAESFYAMYDDIGVYPTDKYIGMPIRAISKIKNDKTLNNEYIKVLDEQSFSLKTNKYGEVIANPIDIGLSVKWASHNIGAKKPEEKGDMYSWGSTTKNKKNNSDISNNISGTKYDVAHVKWGDKWRIPTSEEIDELINKCKWQWIEYKGTNGALIQGPNGNFIFLPINSDVSGSYGSSSLYKNSSTYSIYLFFYKNKKNGLIDKYTVDGTKENLNTIRPVY